MPRRAAAVLAAALLAGVPVACSSDDDAPEDAAPTPTSTDQAVDPNTPAEPASEGPAVELVASTDGLTCFAGTSPGDLAWFDLTWRAVRDLDELDFELVAPRGVRKVGPTYSVPPVNVGGEIAFGGSATWKGWRRAVRNPQVNADGIEDLSFLSPVEGQSGMVVLRLRFDDAALAGDGAGFDGVRATWTDTVGGTGQVEAVAPNAYRTGRC